MDGNLPETRLLQRCTERQKLRPSVYGRGDAPGVSRIDERARAQALGFGDVTLRVADQRLLSGIEALNGMLLLGWSTALPFAVVQRIWAGPERGGSAG